MGACSNGDQSAHTWNVFMCFFRYAIYVALYQPLLNGRLCETITLSLAAANTFNRRSLLFEDILKLLNIYCIFFCCKRLHLIEAIKEKLHNYRQAYISPNPR